MRGPQNTYKTARNRGNEWLENVSVAYSLVIKERTPIEFISAAFVTELLSIYFLCTVVACILMLSKFYLPNPTCFGLITIIRERII
jgi:hypothetical protein